MMSYAVPLLAIILLCACWAIFQLWLARHEPDANRRSLRCGDCGREEKCER